MKKFLTVLLALSVVFTYSFSAVGSAFAATDAPSKDSVYTQATQKANEQMTIVKAAGTKWVNSQTYVPSGVDVDKELKAKHVNFTLDGANVWFTPAGVKKLQSVIEKKVSDEISAKVAEITAATYATQAELDTALAGIVAIADKYDAPDEFFSTASIKKAELEKYEKEYAIADYTAYVNSIDETKYSSKPDNNGVIYQQKVKELKEEALVNIANAEDAYLSDKSARTYANNFYTELKKYPTVETEEENFKNLEEAKAYYSTKAESELIAQKADQKYALNQALKQAKKDKDTAKAEKIEKALANIDADFEAAVKSAKAEIGYCETIPAVEAMYNSWHAAIPNLKYEASNNYVGGGYMPIYIERAEKAAELEALAAKMKAETGFNGNPVYDAAEVDKALADDIKAVYTNQEPEALASLVPVEDLLKGEMDRVINGEGTTGKVTIEKIKYDAVNKWTTSNKYDVVDKLDEVKALVAETKKAIRSAATIADVDAAFLTAYEKYDAIVTDADLNKYQSTVAGKAAVEKYAAKLAAELAGKKADYGTNKFEADYESTAALIDNLTAKYLKKAFNAEDMDAKYQEALNVIKTLKNKAELKAEADAINAEILELSKATLTAADEEKVLAVAEREEAFTEYKALIGVTGYVTYGTAAYKAEMKALVKKELQKAKDAIGTVTVEDEAAIADLAAKAEAFEDNYGDKFDVSDLKAKLIDAKVDAVEKAIGAIDASAQKLDVKAIKAAREAYDALGEYGLLVSPTMYHKLLSLENLAKDYMIKSVKAVKVVKNHSKAGKGYIKIAWSTIGDTSAIDGYRVYRSTKANSGYKYIFQTKNKSYKNTKSLKKGTRYYYKVRAYVELDGKRYFSDYSNKAYRAAK